MQNTVLNSFYSLNGINRSYVHSYKKIKDIVINIWCIIEYFLIFFTDHRKLNELNLPKENFLYLLTPTSPTAESAEDSSAAAGTSNR